MDPSGNGNPRKWVESVLHEYEVRLLRYAERIAGDAETAADVVQFAFLKLCAEVLPPGDRGSSPDGRVAQKKKSSRRKAQAEETTHQPGPAGKSYGEIRHVGQWLYRVCRNRAIDLLRQAGRMPTVDTRNMDGHDADSGALYRRNEPSATSESAAETSDTCAALKGIMAELPAGQQEVVDLWADGLSYREIAGVTGRTEVNVRVTAHRAFKALREHPLTRRLAAAEL